MHGDEAYRNYLDWMAVQNHGRQRIYKAYQDPVAWDRLLADMSRPSHMMLLPQHEDIGPALKSLPAYCTPSTTPANHPRPNETETHGFSFLGSFPSEVRNAIYQYVVDYPSCRELFDAYYYQHDTPRARDSNDFTVNLYTPSILLLCKQITREALTIFRLCPFVIDRIPPWVMGNSAPLPLTHLMGNGTLQNLRFIEIKLSLGDGEKCLSGSVWQHVLEDVLRVLSEKNSLVRLKVMIKVSGVETNNRLWDYELKNYINIVTMIDRFAFKYGSRPDLVQYEHWVLDGIYAYRADYGNHQIRKYPDPHIWQGSVMEWI